MRKNETDGEFEEEESQEGIEPLKEPAKRWNGIPKPNGQIKPGRRSSLHQVYDMQQDAYAIARKLAQSALESKDRDEQARLASAFSSASSVWTKLQDTKREIRGKGKVLPVPAKQVKQKSLTYEINEEAISCVSPRTNAVSWHCKSTLP